MVRICAISSGSWWSGPLPPPPNPISSKVKANAGELLGVYGLVRHLVEISMQEDRLRPQVASFRAVCRCMDVILMCKRGVADPRAGADALERSLAEHMRLHRAAYGTTHIKPKHHWQLDVPAQFRRDGCVLDAFIIERIHLQVKRVAEHVKNTATFERSVLAGVVNGHFRRISEAQGSTGLRGPTAPWPGVPGFVVADRMEYLGLTAAVGDLVFKGEELGEVLACGTGCGALVVFVKLMEHRARLTPTAARWRGTNAHQAWLAQHIEQAHAWRADEGGCVTVLRL